MFMGKTNSISEKQIVNYIEFPWGIIYSLIKEKVLFFYLSITNKFESNSNTETLNRSRI
jgi:hypothetical protein